MSTRAVASILLALSTLMSCADEPEETLEPCDALCADVGIGSYQATAYVYSDALFRGGVRRYALSHNWLAPKASQAHSW